ncbi:MAG: hypothetical protein ACPGJV_13435 [Bacteriovoracaceae bacterium]
MRLLVLGILLGLPLITHSNELIRFDKDYLNSYGSYRSESFNINHYSKCLSQISGYNTSEKLFNQSPGIYIGKYKNKPSLFYKNGDHFKVFYIGSSKTIHVDGKAFSVVGGEEVKVSIVESSSKSSRPDHILDTNHPEIHNLFSNIVNHMSGNIVEDFKSKQEVAKVSSDLDPVGTKEMFTLMMCIKVSKVTSNSLLKQQLDRFIRVFPTYIERSSRKTSSKKPASSDAKK